MLDLKSLKSALEQLEEERNIPRDKIIAAIEDALVAAYKKDYGKKNQIVRARVDLDTGVIKFEQVKIVVDETMLKPETETKPELAETGADAPDDRLRFHEDRHILLADARKIKKDAQVNDELVFPLETREDYGRIAAQTAKQVIIQRIREAEKYAILDEYEHKVGEVVSGKVQRVERGNVFVDLGRTTALLPREGQIPGEFYRPGERIRAYLEVAEETPRGITLRLSRSHPKFVEKLFTLEAPEVANGSVQIKLIAREAGGRTKLAVTATDPHIDPIGSCVGQRGARVSTVINELGGEKIDIIEWSTEPRTFVTQALSPAKIEAVNLDEATQTARVEVAPDQFSLAVGRGGQNVRLASKLTGWKIDIVPPPGEELAAELLADETINNNQKENHA